MTKKDDESLAGRPRVHVVDDDRAMRDSMKFLLEAVDLSVATYESAEDFLENDLHAVRGCVVLDVRMAGMSGIQLHEKLRAEGLGIPVIIVTGHSDVPMAVRAMRAGAFDLLEKPFDDEELLERIHEALAVDASTRAEEHDLAEIKKRMALLSPREDEVMRLVVAGLLNKQIASKLELSIKTVEVHRSRVMQKMEAKSLADLVRQTMIAGVDVGESE